MKKIFLTIFASGLILTSCDMDLDQPGSKRDDTSIEDAEDCRSFRNNIYSSFRALTSGSYITDTELEMDHFIALYDNGSRGMTFNTATINSQNSDITSLYSGCYSVMKNINFLIEKGTGLLEGGSLTDSDATDVTRYVGEARFFRAYIYTYLFDHYCQAYDSSKADQEGLGLSLVTVYDPTGDTSKYPGRSSMNDAFQLIEDDLDYAYNALVAYEQTDNSNCMPNAPYLSSYAISAMQARVALLKGDYTTAMTKANAVINSGIFTLAEGDDYFNMWINDSGSELIMVPFVDASESAYVGSFLDAFAYTSNYPTRVDYIPSYSTLLMYDDGDIRFDSFFDVLSMQIGGQNAASYIFLKYPGNNDLVSGSNEYKNKPKPFRLSEQYLILAEAAAESGQSTAANNALNTLRAARIEGYTDMTYSGSELINQIRDERDKELLGEGFRMSDLRRWGLGFTRDGSYPINPALTDLFIPTSLTVQFSAGDYRYTWPIPYEEMQINPQLKGQQNPGYGD